MPNEPDTYRIEHLYLQFAFEFDRHRLTYRIRLVSLPENPASPQPTYFWSSDELQLMETFFTDHLFPSLRLPQSANDQNSSLIDAFTVAIFQSFCMTFQVFARMLCFIQARVLKDLVKIIEIEQVHRQRRTISLDLFEFFTDARSATSLACTVVFEIT